MERTCAPPRPGPYPDYKPPRILLHAAGSFAITKFVTKSVAALRNTRRHRRDVPHPIARRILDCCDHVFKRLNVFQTVERDSTGHHRFLTHASYSRDTLFGKQGEKMPEETQAMPTPLSKAGVVREEKSKCAQPAERTSFAVPPTSRYRMCRA